MRTFKLCLNAGSGSAPYINVNQYDEGETWLFELYSENGERYIPSSGAIVGVKSDGHGIVNTGTVDSEGRVVITETQQMTASAGRAIYELSIDGLTHGTANFIVAVERKPTDDAVMSDSDLSLIQEAIDSAAEIEDLLDGQDVPTVITPIISDWLDENITNPSNPPIDTSLTVAGAAADAKATGDEIADLKSATTKEFSVTRAKMVLVESENLLNPANLTVGYISANGSISDNTSYRFTDFIPVTPGETISFWRSRSDGITTNGPINSRFCCAFNSNKNVTTGGVDATISTFVVPSGVSFMRFSFAASYFDYSVMVKRGAETPPYISAYFEPYYVATPEFMPRPYKIGNGYESKAAETSTGINLELLSTNIAKDLLYAFSAEIGNDFTNLIIGSGYPNGSYKSYITIDATNLTFNINGSDYVFPHGLTIADYIKVTIDINDNTKAKVTLTSGGSQFTKTLGWYGFHTDKYAAFSNTGAFSNAVFTVAFKDINANTYVFGDSYVAIVESTSKWSHWLVADGYGKNALLNAYPGEDSANALNALQTLLSVGCPKYLLWCLGMNDGGDTDAETPSSAWMAGINKVLELCEANDITPVFATIPTVPSYNHEAKNAWVRSSGYRYVDFSKAVGANASGVWFSGMLSTDNIHPSELGAKALWHQVLCDFPEITM